MEAFMILPLPALPLMEAVACMLGVALGRCEVARYPDGEVSVVIDEPVHGARCHFSALIATTVRWFVSASA